LVVLVGWADNDANTANSANTDNKNGFIGLIYLIVVILSEAKDLIKTVPSLRSG
jgi:hypothetical protein